MNDPMIRATFPVLDAAMTRIGPTTPHNHLVICPHCTSQFRAIPVDVQEEISGLKQDLEKYMQIANIEVNNSGELLRRLTRLQAHINTLKSLVEAWDKLRDCKSEDYRIQLSARAHVLDSVMITVRDLVAVVAS